jgi:Right handed beta helix region
MNKPCSFLLLFLLCGPVAVHAVSFDVTDRSDTHDVNPGDGTCRDSAGHCTLRAAAEESKAFSVAPCPSATDTSVTLRVAGTINVSLSKNVDFSAGECNRYVTIAGPGATTLTVSGGGIVLGGGTASHSTITGLTITGADTGIQDLGGTVNSTSLSDVVVTGCHIGIQLFNENALSLVESRVTSNTGDGIAVFDGSLVGINLTDSVVANNAGAGLAAHSIVSLTLLRSVVSGNDGIGISAGGGVYTPNIAITDSTIDGNGAEGLRAYGESTTVSGTTVSNNSGTGVVISQGPLIVANSTISGNRSPTDGGGILVEDAGQLQLNNATISGNFADDDATGTGMGGGVLVVSPGTASMSNTIVSGNVDRSGRAPDCGGKIVSNLYNIVGNTTGCTVTLSNGNPDVTTIAGQDPGLGALASNGGPTETRALPAGSVAVNSGNPAIPGTGSGACEATDQRGVLRSPLMAGRCDIGAYEYVPTTTTTLGSTTTSTGEGSTTTTPSTSTTSTTAEPILCGNGKLDPGEECDDGDLLSETDCCNQNCRARRIGTPCGMPPDGDCDEQDSCDGVGHCIASVQPEGVTCRVERTKGVCDLGDVCDGNDTECPITNSEAGCDAVPPTDVVGDSISFDCVTRLPQPNAKVTCKAVGYDADAPRAGLLAGGRKKRRQGGGTTKVTTQARQRVTRKTAPDERRVRLTLHLTRNGRRLLRDRDGLLRVGITTRLSIPGTTLRVLYRVTLVHAHR